MTAQAMEVLYIDGKRHYMASEPFNDYLESMNNPPELLSPNTTCWRGYYGRWTIWRNKLYMLGLQAFIDKDGKIEELGMAYL